MIDNLELLAAAEEEKERKRPTLDNRFQRLRDFLGQKSFSYKISLSSLIPILIAAITAVVYITTAHAGLERDYTARDAAVQVELKAELSKQYVSNSEYKESTARLEERQKSIKEDLTETKGEIKDVKSDVSEIKRMIMDLHKSLPQHKRTYAPPKSRSAETE